MQPVLTALMLFVVIEFEQILWEP